MVNTRNQKDNNINNSSMEIINDSLLKKIPSKNITFITELWNIVKIYLFWIVVHFVSSNLYSHLCTNMSLWGLLSSPFLVVSPHCKALFWLTNNSITNITNMWLVLGTWFMTKLKKE